MFAILGISLLKNKLKYCHYQNNLNFSIFGVGKELVLQLIFNELKKI